MRFTRETLDFWQPEDLPLLLRSGILLLADFKITTLMSMIESATWSGENKANMEEFVGSKRCSKCNEVKSLIEFNRSAKSKDGYQWFCKGCAKTYNKKRYVYDMEVSRSKHLKRTYGLTPEKYQAMFITQNGVCAACGQPETTNDPRTKQIKNLHVDHCHTTGKVRDLLCQECNNALGLLHDDPRRIRLLLQYAEHHHGSHVPTTISSSEGASE